MTTPAERNAYRQRVIREHRAALVALLARVGTLDELELEGASSSTRGDAVAPSQVVAVAAPT